ncbi:efflux transporter outer membrane subunit [Candidatus Methylomicrobium oryzae]|uniref:efflux transporter outer membrane subunit n=1 Tax=Candidatus Methylomicrobium oryzae TaxID=2802053 RepID=UPI001920EAE9|nr:efflux transporter outer membrane subunit [Methylomicrobium sp. RS1]MBL1266033.1 efflux transporter outer membrane subunit [Methylomicrobium sp. RS1]
MSGAEPIKNRTKSFSTDCPRHLHKVLICLAVLLSACVEVPDRNPVKDAVGLPPAWTARPAEAHKSEVSAWLANFKNDDLKVLIAAALDGNNDLKATATRIAQARALARIEGAAAKPQADLAPGFQHADAGREARAYAPDGNVWSVPFNFSWEWDVWGRIGDARTAAELESDAAGADLRGAALSLAARTAQGCFELAEARQRVAVVQASIDDRGALVELLQGRFNLGLAQGLDLSLALTDLSDARAELNDAANQVQLAQRRLEVLLGHYPAGAVERCRQLPELPAAMPSGLPAELLNRRPDIVAAFARLRAQDHRLSSARKALLPRVTLAASGGSLGRTLADLSDPRSAAWNLALGLTQPLYAGDRLQADIDLRAAQSGEALHRYRETVLQALREVEQSLAAEAWLRGREQALNAAVKQTETSRALAIYSYRNGTVDILTLLDSYRSTLIAQTALLDARLKLLNNRLDLYLALGGGV